MEPQKITNSQSYPKEESLAGGLWLYFKWYRAAVINTENKLDRETSGTEQKKKKKNQKGFKKYAAEKRQHIQENGDGQMVMDLFRSILFTLYQKLS